MGPLAGMRILDMSRLLPGPYCTRLLADMGADVIKIEEPGRGDYSREFAPFRKDLGCWFMEVNRNKRGIVLDLKTAEGREHFLELVATADAVVESYRPGVLERLGIDFATAAKVNPRIVYCSLSGYGPEGPLHLQADHDIGYLSLTGPVSMSGDSEGRPSIPGVLIADMNACTMAGMSLLAAIRHAEKTGEGQCLTVSLYDTAINTMPGVAAAYFGDGTVHQRGNNWLTGTNPNYNIYRTADGKYMSVGCLEQKFWSNLCRALGKPEYIPMLEDAGNYDFLKKELAAVFASRTQAEWIELLDGKDTCARPVLDFAEACAAEQTKANGMVLHIHDEELGDYCQMGFVPKFSATPCEFYRRAPRLGEQTEEILQELQNLKQK